MVWPRVTLLLGWSGRTNHGVVVVIVHRLSSVRIHMCIVSMIYVRSSAGDMQIRESTEAGSPTEAGGPLLYFFYLPSVHMSSASWSRVHRGGWQTTQNPPRRVACSPESTEASGTQPQSPPRLVARSSRDHRGEWHAAPETTEAGGPTGAGGFIHLYICASLSFIFRSSSCYVYCYRIYVYIVLFLPPSLRP